MGSICSRRATNTSVSAEAGSSQRAWPTRHSSGRHHVQQAEHGQIHQEPVGVPLRLDQAEGAPQRLGLGGGDPIQPIQDRLQQLLEGGKGKRDLGLDPGTPQQPETGSLLGRILEHGVLADAGLPPDDQHASMAGSRPLEQGSELGAFLAPSIQHGGIPVGVRGRSLGWGGWPIGTVRLA
jgi:hypothetical protein